MIRPYWSVLSARFRMLLQYRAAAAAGVGTQLFWGLIRVMVFEGFYRSSPETQPLSREQMVTYVWLGQAMLGLLFWNVDTDIRAMMRNGTVAYELARPVDLYAFWYSRAVAARVAPTLLRSVPIFVLAGLFFGLQAPASLPAFAGWVVTTAGAVLISSALATLVTISLLWTISGDGMARLMPALVYTFSGVLVPLPLLPEWAQAVLNVLPFRGMADLPFRVWMGDIPVSELPPALAHQLVWTAVLVLMGRALLARGARRLVVQGG